MFKQKLVLTVFLCLTLLWILTASIALGQGGISLKRTPAPPQTVFNDGTGSVSFSWTIDYATQFNQNYILEIIDPNGNVVHCDSFIGAPSQIANSTTWPVPAGATSGPYYGRLSFFSNWWPPEPNKFECQASAGFLVCPAARIRIRKFWDWLDANGIKDGVEETLEGWRFVVKRLDTCQEWTLTSGFDGNTESLMVPVKASGTTDFTITEEIRPGWVKTGPNGSVNPVTISLAPGCSYHEDYGNWQPINITGYKFLDENPCPLPGAFPITTTTRLPNSKALAGIIIRLFSYNWDLLDTAITDANGHFAFPTRTWEDRFYIMEEIPHPEAPTFDLPQATPFVCIDHQLTRWQGLYHCSASQSPWQSPHLNFETPDTITLDIAEPDVACKNYGDNYFYNQLPSRIWGVMCADGIKLGNIKVEKDNSLWEDAAVQQDCGLYVVPTRPEEPQGLRCGKYVLTPPDLPDPKTQEWLVTEYCCDNWVIDPHTTVVPSGGSYPLKHDVDSCHDVRVDFCIQTAPSNRICNLPVTFTQEGYKTFSDPENGVIQGGIIYNKFNLAFANNKLIVGTTKTITFDGTSGSLKRLCMFLPQTGACGKLDRNYIDPWDHTPAGALAGEQIALLLNIAYNKAAIMPRTPGWDLEKFTINSGFFKGRTVGEVYNIANALLGGDLPSRYGLNGYQALLETIQAINANYEFVNWNTYNDRGYLTRFGSAKKSGEGTPITVPYRF
ncbi:MAG: hypothetical protein NT018_14065 [Armatimonadetes bacterium]|nr:hypothetical protein [Armatimonadota bacterium]